jgi:hypothetical protein
MKGFIGKISRFGKDRNGRIRYHLELPVGITPLVEEGMEVECRFKKS